MSWIGAFLVITAAQSPYTVQITDYIIFADASAGPISLILPAADNSGRFLAIKKTDASSNAVTLFGIVDSLTNYRLPLQNQSVEMQSTSTQWNVTQAYVMPLVPSITVSIGAVTVNAVAIPIPLSESRTLRTVFRGQTAGAIDCCSQVTIGLWQNVAGVVSRIGGLDNVMALKRSGGIIAVGCDMIIVGAGVVPQVTGKVGKTINWVISTEIS